MAQNYRKALFQWIESAEEARKNRDYEGAARLFRYVSVYFGLINDPSNRREFTMKTGECYFQAARKSEDRNDLLKAILLYIKAAKCFWESGYERMARTCDFLIRKHHVTIAENNPNFYESISDLKSIGDYFRDNGDDKNAAECYRMAAEKAYENGKIALSGSLYADVGDRHRALGDFEKAAESYEQAAGRYLECEEHFQAARYYCHSGFLYIHAQNLGKAFLMAQRADAACVKGDIDIILDDLSRICRLLSERDLEGAMDVWGSIRRKFKRSYVELIDSCFRVVRQIISHR
ncbi:MAG: hypothetical protein ACE5NN_06355 [Candidatus Bathyarchaeia archaeon]